MKVWKIHLEEKHFSTFFLLLIFSLSSFQKLLKTEKKMPSLSAMATKYFEADAH